MEDFPSSSSHHMEGGLEGDEEGKGKGKGKERQPRMRKTGISPAWLAVLPAARYLLMRTPGFLVLLLSPTSSNTRNVHSGPPANLPTYLAVPSAA
ncbi:hypothetical protein S7711_10385 [Stachybotrys chartarum IBT 7711]|uniref:Uncharacterized protein n=1 Tax=Stachybotrys chartarum (strain CBS 109288 / IBT 7711) TaxID=1280523 RepID=A0A084B023_STACB|nr:hypothetical protein S7711_10385 [Stachybotrys chartarum IBT 7711]KFA49584.1 hypothetical protein S40293_10655 [Stachybotrys chartarum IBT 40293]